jgi:hypothetical protein
LATICTKVWSEVPHHRRLGAQFRPVARGQGMVLQAVAVLQHEQLGLVDCRRRDAVGQVQRSGTRREGDVEPVVEQGRGLDLAAREWEGEQHAIELAALEIVAGGLAGLLAQEQPELRIIGTQPREQAGQQEGGDGGNHAHAQLARQRLAGGPGHVGQLLGLAQHLACLQRDLRAERGEAHDAAGPLHQSDADQRLELANAGGHGGLGDETGIRGPAEMAGILERHQILELLQSGQVSRHRLRRFL